MTKDHRNIRAGLDSFQKDRWQSEAMKRSARIRRGFKGIWDKLNGRYWKTRKRNEHETWHANIRDQKQREELIQQQLSERQDLQKQLNLLQKGQDKERSALIRDLSHATKSEKIKHRKQENSITKDSKNYKINMIMTIQILILNQKFK